MLILEILYRYYSLPVALLQLLSINIDSRYIDSTHFRYYFTDYSLLVLLLCTIWILRGRNLLDRQKK